MNPIETPFYQKENQSLSLLSIKQELHDLFVLENDPVAVLVERINKNETAGKISKELSEATIFKLQSLNSQNEESFVNDATKILVPILEITKKEEMGDSKREMFSTTDLETAINLIKKNDVSRIYVVGNVGSGKTRFSEQLSSLLNYNNIDLDRQFKYFEKEHNRKASDLKELLEYVLKNNEPPFIINHADLLRQDLISDADMVVLLNPKKEELLKSRQLRAENSADGEWKNVSVDDYDKIADLNLNKLEELNGENVYNNEETGTIISLLNNK